MILSIDIGGTKVAAALVESGRIVERRQVRMVQDVASFELALDALVESMPMPDRVSVASTGFIANGNVHAVNKSIISFWNGFALHDCLAARFDCPIDLMNDAQAAAWGEYLTTKAPVSNFLYLTLSTGVGGGLVIGNKLQIGSRGLAGHIGHTTVSASAIDGINVCGCGRANCLETIASGTAIARQAAYVYGEVTSSQEVFARAQTDTRAQHILERAAGAVAEAIANCVLMLDVERVAIGGSVGLAPGMVERIQAVLADGPKLAEIPVARALLGADSGLLGAARWAAASDCAVAVGGADTS